jgi:hypothetical protein
MTAPAAETFNEQSDQIFKDMLGDLELDADRIFEVLCGPRKWNRATDKRTVDYVSAEFPTRQQLHGFERASFRERQMVLARLHGLQARSSLKFAPIAMGYLAATIALAALVLRELLPTPIGPIMTLVVLLLIGFLGAYLLWEKPRFSRRDGNLASWVESFKDSHALATKKEEEARKP